jgi:hypothetical protein
MTCLLVHLVGVAFCLRCLGMWSLIIHIGFSVLFFGYPCLISSTIANIQRRLCAIVLRVTVSECASAKCLNRLTDTIRTATHVLTPFLAFSRLVFSLQDHSVPFLCLILASFCFLDTPLLPFDIPYLRSYLAP